MHHGTPLPWGANNGSLPHAVVHHGHRDTDGAGSSLHATTAPRHPEIRRPPHNLRAEAKPATPNPPPPCPRGRHPSMPAPASPKDRAGPDQPPSGLDRPWPHQPADASVAPPRHHPLRGHLNHGTADNSRNRRSSAGLRHAMTPPGPPAPTDLGRGLDPWLRATSAPSSRRPKHLGLHRVPGPPPVPLAPGEPSSSP
nr:vegetative cell wall protein gp1-like [Lolium perenne]